MGICQGLLDAKWLESITGEDVFRDEYVLYKAGAVSSLLILLENKMQCSQLSTVRACLENLLFSLTFCDIFFRQLLRRVASLISQLPRMQP